MQVRDLKDLRARDLKDVKRDDVIELLDELRTIASKGATELLTGGKKSARRAIGAPEPGSVSSAMIGGVVIGLIVGALFALVFTPFSAGEARRRITSEMEKVRERRMPNAPRRESNGAAQWDETPETVRSPKTGEPAAPPS